MSPGRTQRLGAWGEAQACLFLQRQEFVVVERNYHTTAGEIDIVARKSDDYYFIEVKTRHAGDLASDLAVTRDKKYKLSKTVKMYCFRKQIAEKGIVLASLMVIIDRAKTTVNFRLAVLF